MHVRRVHWRRRRILFGRTRVYICPGWCSGKKPVDRRDQWPCVVFQGQLLLRTWKKFNQNPYSARRGFRGSRQNRRRTCDLKGLSRICRFLFLLLLPAPGQPTPGKPDERTLRNCAAAGWTTRGRLDEDEVGFLHSLSVTHVYNDRHPLTARERDTGKLTFFWEGGGQLSLLIMYKVSPLADWLFRGTWNVTFRGWRLRPHS